MAAANDDFDPYHKWLGIPREQRPITHYLLLGIAPTEKDLDVIEDAAIRQTTHVRSYQFGPHAEACQRVLNEIASARQTLLSPRSGGRTTRVSPGCAAAADSWLWSSPVVTAPSPTKPSTRPKPAKKAASPRRAPSRNNTLLLGLAVGGVSVAVLAVVALVVMSQSAPVVRKDTPSNAEPTARVEPKSAPPVDVHKSDPKIAEIDKTPAKKPEPDKTPVVKKVEVSSPSAE